MALSIGISIGRRAAGIVVSDTGTGTAQIAWAHQLPRPAGQTAVQALDEILRHLPETFKGLSASLALSPGDLACADALDLAPGIAWRTLPRLGPALCEARCAGESSEELSADLVPAGSQAHAVAMRTLTLEALRTTATSKGLSLRLVTATPIALGYVFSAGPIDLTSAGERFQIERTGNRLGWRAFPVNSPEEASRNGTLSWRESPVPPGQAAAFAAAVADPDEVPNLLLGLPGAPRSVGARCRRSLTALGIAATILLGSVAFLFNSEARVIEIEMGQIRQAESQLWSKYLPGRPPREGGLLRAMKQHLAETGANTGDANALSVLTLWAEIARCLPDVDETGMTLETLDIAPDEARFTVRVQAAPDDPMKNAALIEERLNRSEKIRARGDYEAKDKEVVVRLRVEYKAGNEKRK